MAGLSFRPRPIEPLIPIPIRIGLDDEEEDACAITRTVPRLATGMEEEEENEAHIRHAIRRPTAANSIPTPRVIIVDGYDTAPITQPFNRTASYICCQGYTRSRVWTTYEDDSISLVEYDADSEDEGWLSTFNHPKNLLTREKFEFIIDRLEKENERFCQIYESTELMPCPKLERQYNVKMNVLQAVYNHWAHRRNSQGHQFLRRLEKPTDPNDPCPYKAFRPPMDEKQKKKGRRNDKGTYTKMLNLRQEFERARTLFELMVKREKMKRDIIATMNQVFQQQHSHYTKASRHKSEKKSVQHSSQSKENKQQATELNSSGVTEDTDEFILKGPSFSPAESRTSLTSTTVPENSRSQLKATKEPLLTNLFDFAKFRSEFYPSHNSPQPAKSVKDGRISKDRLAILFRKPPGGGRSFYGRFRRGRGGRVFIDRIRYADNEEDESLVDAPSEEKAVASEMPQQESSLSFSKKETNTPASLPKDYQKYVQFVEPPPSLRAEEITFQSILREINEPFFCDEEYTFGSFSQTATTSSFAKAFDADHILATPSRSSMMDLTNEDLDEIDLTSPQSSRSRAITNDKDYNIGTSLEKEEAKYDDYASSLQGIPATLLLSREKFIPKYKADLLQSARSTTSESCAADIQPHSPQSGHLKTDAHHTKSDVPPHNGFASPTEDTMDVSISQTAEETTHKVLFPQPTKESPSPPDSIVPNPQTPGEKCLVLNPVSCVIST